MTAAMFREMVFYEPLQCPTLNSSWASQRPLEKWTEHSFESQMMQFCCKGYFKMSVVMFRELAFYEHLQCPQLNST